MIIGICGLAGAGKDTVADLLVRKHGFAKLSFADPMKRFCKEVFDFTDEQLWGPSASRNAPDERYPRERTGLSGSPAFLTPRYALQQLGTEWGRDCYAPIWCELALRHSKRLMEYVHYRYTAKRGLYEEVDGTEATAPKGVAISDCRFANEIQAVQKAGGKVIRVVRPGSGLGGTAGLHQSEVEQASIPDSSFDAILVNDGTLDGLENKLGSLLFDLEVAAETARLEKAKEEMRVPF